MNAIVGNKPRKDGRYLVWIMRYDYERDPVRKFPIECILEFHDGEWYYADSNKTVRQRAIIGAFLGPLPEFEIVNGDMRAKIFGNADKAEDGLFE